MRLEHSLEAQKKNKKVALLTEEQQGLIFKFSK